MRTQYKFFHIPTKYSTDVESELNNFLKNNQILQIHRGVHPMDGGRSIVRHPSCSS
ncbi:hypothetical protein MHK_002334 [Candidatus Magnetomorum sp. HK-1]|nr:hypothetical protein MHK_002334 [Candidatus Magnetomorum sp. HK-1]